MKQTLVLALFSFLVSVAGATWFAAYLAPPRPVATERTPTPAKAGAATQPVPARPSRDSGAGVDPVKAPGPPPPAPVAPPKADTAGDGTRAKSVAKILAAMKPKAAADIVARLDDDEVDRIVRQLNAKQVAALLAVLPQERAARLSRRLLEPKTGRQGGT